MSVATTWPWGRPAPRGRERSNRHRRRLPGIASRRPTPMRSNVASVAGSAMASRRAQPLQLGAAARRTHTRRSSRSAVRPQAPMSGDAVTSIRPSATAARCCSTSSVATSPRSARAAARLLTCAISAARAVGSGDGDEAVGGDVVQAPLAEQPRQLASTAQIDAGAANRSSTSSRIRLARGTSSPRSAHEWAASR